MTRFQDFSQKKTLAYFGEPRTAIRRVQTPGAAWAASRFLRPAGLCLLSAIAAALVVGLVGHISYIRPLNTALASQEAGAVARELDAIVKTRGAAIKMAINSLELRQGLNSASLEQLMTGFSRTFPDFLSLEITNEHGEVLAMIGDLSLSEAGRPTGSELSGGRGIDPAGAFGDEPAQNSFFVAQEERAPGGERWIARARFSRASIDKALNSAAGVPAAKLIHTSMNQSPALSSLTGVAAGLRDLWDAPLVAEVALAAPGWSVRLERPTGRGLLFYPTALIVGLFALAASGLYLIPRMAPRLDWLTLPEKRMAESKTEEISANDVSDREDGSGRQLELDLSRNVEIRPIMPTEITASVALAFPDISDPEFDAAKEAERQMIVLAAREGRPAGIPELLEVSWDEFSSEDHSTGPVGAKPQSFAVP